MPDGDQQFPEEQSQTGRFQTRLQSLMDLDLAVVFTRLHYVGI